MKEEIKIDANRLITEVYKRPALWNQKHVLYHNRDVTNRIWIDLSTLLKLPKTVLKAKWKGLRDTFRAEIKKEQIYHKSKFPRNRPIWMHYKHLLFLKEQMLPRPPIWERTDCTENSENACSREKNEKAATVVTKTPIKKTNVARKVTQNNSNGVASSSNHCTADPKGEAKRSSVKLKSPPLATSSRQVCDARAHHTLTADATESVSVTEVDEHQITVKQEPIEDIVPESKDFQNASSGENDMMLQTIPPEQVLIAGSDATCDEVDPLEGNRLDDNYYFFMSLLPHIRTLPSERRMLLRMQMQELVYKEVYKKNTGVDGPTSS